MKYHSAAELEYCVVKKCGQLMHSASNKQLGELLFVRKQLELAPFKALAFKGWGDWEQDPLKNRSWQWRLNWLSFLSYLIAYHRASGHDGVLDLGKAAIESWLDTYLDTEQSYPFEFIWHDHATALRAEQIVLFIYYCLIHAPAWSTTQAAFLAKAENALQVHGALLAKDSFYSEHTNHGLEQARVLLLLGTVFEGEQAETWVQIALRRIASELEFSFTNEGVHVENSPAYHVFVFKVFLEIINDYPGNVLGGLGEEFNQLFIKVLNFITRILRPDGLLPPIGDSEQLPTSDAYRTRFGHTLSYQEFLYALTKGKSGLRPSVVNRVYADSGYAIFRDQWPNKKDFDKAFHLVVKIGTSSRYHHQQDEGHISLYGGGEDWLIDSGMYNYVATDPVRRYMRSRVAHNVPLISHASYDQDFEHRLGAWAVIDYDESVPTPFVEMRLEVMPPVIHKRRVAFDNEALVLMVDDNISANDDTLRNITLQWHFPKDKEILIEGETAVINSPLGNKLVVSFEGGDIERLNIVQGTKEDRVFSCISYKANKVEPSQTLQAIFTARNNLDVKTRFRFELAAGQVIDMQKNAPPHVVRTLAYLLDSWQSREPVTHSVVLGMAVGLAFVQAHRKQAVGRVSLLMQSAALCHEMKTLLEAHALSEWCGTRAIQFSLNYPVGVSDSDLDDLEDINILFINGDGFPEKKLESFVVVVLPLLLKRMSKDAELWVSELLSDELIQLCESWARQQEIPITLVRV